MGPTPALAIDRRTFIGRCATSGAALLALTTSACTGHDVGDRRRVANPLLLGALGTARVTAIGKQWLRLTPAERTAHALVAAITARLNGAPWAQARTVDEVVADDFEQGRTVMVDGWLLAVTEARQCALFALLAG